MKKLVSVLALVFVLAGCGGKHEDLDRAMVLRSKFLAAGGCSFDAVITADYGDKIHTFGVTCTADGQGNVTFTVTEPETIAGITGKLSGEGGKLTFEDKALAFELLADGQVTPVSAPWLFVKTLRSGYVASYGMDGEQLRISIDDSYEENALHLDYWLGEGDLPVRCEIVYDDRRILSLEVSNFTIV
jgi:hypothetical protein